MDLREVNQDFVCPTCRERLSDSETNVLLCQCGVKYKQENGIINFLNYEELSKEEIKSNSEYKEIAASYDDLMKWYFQVLGEDENKWRQFMVDQLQLKEDHKVLEVGCGTGSDSLFIYDKIKEKGALSLVELSEEMLHLAKSKLQDSYPKESVNNISYSLADVAKLPFPDNHFDAVFHFGGINTFPDSKAAVSELNRVVKEGGKVVFGDESIPAWLRENELANKLMDYNSQYKHHLPLEILEENSKDVTVRYIIGNSFHLIDYTVGANSFKLDMDLKNPYFNKSISSWLAEKNQKLNGLE
jgi:ubiquinone/menaquinone biosynthesis C-methylase UbiE